MENRQQNFKAISENKVLILGGYGNFGKRIATALVKNKIEIIIAGRDKQKTELLQQKINNQYPQSKIDVAIFDVNSELSSYLENLKPAVVINTCGPFQNSDYKLAQICIKHQVAYIDLADGRDFVNKISLLDEEAKKNNVAVISGASTVPGLSSAVLEYYKNDFSAIDSLTFGITPGAKAERGLATTKGILSYLGKPLKLISGNKKPLYGWQNIYLQKYPQIGRRWMANCDIPDLDLFPAKYNIKNIRFSAGMENSLLHLSMWLLSWLIRIGLPVKLENHAEFLLKISYYFDFLGTKNGGMHVIIKGPDKNHQFKKIEWFIIALNGDGPQIPCVPAIILAKKIISGKLNLKGAMPCAGLITLEEYMEELKEFDITTNFSSSAI